MENERNGDTAVMTERTQAEYWVTIPAPWMEGREAQLCKVEEKGILYVNLRFIWLAQLRMTILG